MDRCAELGGKWKWKKKRDRRVDKGHDKRQVDSNKWKYVKGRQEVWKRRKGKIRLEMTNTNRTLEDFPKTLKRLSKDRCLTTLQTQFASKLLGFLVTGYRFFKD